MNLSIIIKHKCLIIKRNGIGIPRQRFNIILYMVCVVVASRVVCKAERCTFCLHYVNITNISVVIKY